MNEHAPARTERIEVTRGFVAFVGAMVLPAVLALAVFLGAWAVSDEVYAAEAQAAAVEDGGASVSGEAPADEVAGWKRSLVGVCPIH